jgi:CRP-like cAMP-binding protein
MDLETPIGKLESHPFFEGMKKRHLKIIAAHSSDVQFDPGQFIFHEGEEANNFYLIRHGRVALETFTPERGAITIERLGAGDALGWSWLITPFIWHFDATAVEPTLAIALDGLSLRKLCDEDADLGYELMKRVAHIMAHRLDATILRLVDFYGAKI